MRNLLGRLLQRSPAELERIARAWAVELGGSDRHTDVSYLYRTMTDIWAVRDVWERVSDTGKQLMRALDEHNGASCPPEQVLAEAGISAEEGLPELRRLYEIGIIAAEDRAPGSEGDAEPAIFLPREVGLMIERVETERHAVSPRDRGLEDLLTLATYPEIEEAATAWGARVVPALHAREELVGIVSEQLSRSERIERMIAALSAPARNAWARLTVAGGVLALDDLLSPQDVPLAVRRRILRELAAPLLLWHGYDMQGVRLAIVPQIILHPTPIEAVPPPDLIAVDAADVVEPEWIFPYAAAWDLLTVLREIVVSGPRWRALLDEDATLMRRLRKKLWRADRETLDVPTGYVAFVTQVGALLGVLRDDEGRTVAGEAARTWREHAFTGAAQRMVAAWTGADDWLEGRERVDLNLYGASWPTCRAAIIEALGELDAEQWYTQDRFVERLLKVRPNLLRQAQVGAMGRSARGGRADLSNDVLERRFQILSLVIGTTLETACHWLGLIERSYTLDTRTPVLRVTPVGHWIAGKRVEPGMAHLGHAPLAVGANFQTLLFRPTPRRVWALSAFAELQSLDRVSTWTLTAEALIRALASGLDLSQVTTFLERQNDAPLPQNISYTLAEWDRGYRRVWLRRAVILVPDEGEDYGPIAAAIKDAGLVPEVLPDGRIVLVYDEQDAGERLYAAAARTLREHGFAPLTDRPPPA